MPNYLKNIEYCSICKHSKGMHKNKNSRNKIIISKCKASENKILCGCKMFEENIENA